MLAHNTFCLVPCARVCVCCFCISASALISVVDLVWHISRLVCALPILLLFIQKFDAKLCGGPSIRKFFDFFCLSCSAAAAMRISCVCGSSCAFDFYRSFRWGHSPYRTVQSMQPIYTNNSTYFRNFTIQLALSLSPDVPIL